MAAFARFSSSGASNDQAFQHDATPQSPKYITNAKGTKTGQAQQQQLAACPTAQVAVEAIACV